ncbi:uncharacterized protein DNG_03514 [Cephalotrichum gorgonifer]|uniref:BZIP domain-containing protein n=1 Tax=Cephalotrichum gorgonifer TaxID=2041049 RepID=A0AAE8MVD7_9PEZI|nr:uncharacterized protein DNG_03514 [Cephalotrichum gorgonifer]
MELIESSASDSRARIRDNQRRSRLRHREFVDDLQRKVREYEAQGVQATLDMQRAARVVALENSRLRSLLSSKGVSDEEVESYLASPTEPRPTRRKEGRLPGGSLGRRSETPDDTAHSSGLNSPASSSCTPTDAGTLMCLKRLVNEDGPHPFSTLELQPANSTARQDTTNPGARPAHTDATAVPPTNAPAILPSLHTMSLSPHEMSCNTAAQIIARAHSHGDERLARRNLGCADSSNCVIRNTQVLQILQDS